MSQGMFAAVSGIRANQSKLNVISNNLANLNTVAFKSSIVNFKTLFSQTIKGGTRPSEDIGGTNPMQIGNGATVAEINQNMAQGGSLFTGRPADLMIEGEGFFTVEANDVDLGTGSQGFYLTRAGNFSLDGAGFLVTAQGNRVLGTRTLDGNDPNTVTAIQVPSNLQISKARDASGNVTEVWVDPANTTWDAADPDFASVSSVEQVYLINFSVAVDGSITATYSNGDRLSIRSELAPGIPDPVLTGQREFVLVAAEGNDFTESGINSDGSPVPRFVNIGIAAVAANEDPTFIVPEQIQIRMATVTNPSGLIHEGNNLFSVAPNAGDLNLGVGAASGRGKINSGALESSNVDIAAEFTNMIISQRGLEAASKTVTTQSEVMRTIIGLI